MGGIFELGPQLFPELSHFGVNDRTTIRLIGIVAIKILMVILRLIKRGKGADLGDDGIGPEPGRIRVALGFFRADSLLLAVIQNDRTILCADIIALPIQGRWIMGAPEDVEDIFKRNNFRIKRNLYDLCVSGGAITHLII